MNKNGIAIALIMILSSIVIYLIITTISTKETVETLDKAKQEANKSEILLIKSGLELHIQMSKIDYANSKSLKDICNDVSNLLPNVVDYDKEIYDVKCNITNDDENKMYIFKFKNKKSNTNFNIKCTDEKCLD